MAASTTKSNDVDSGRSWFILLALCIVWFLNEGLRKGLSVLLPTLRDQFETHTWMIGVMIALLHGMRDFSGPVMGVLASNVDNRILGTIGGIVSALSVTCASFATNVPVLVLFASIINGIAVASIQVTSYSLLARYFDKYYPLATGVSMACGTFGIMVYAPLTQLLLDTYGWQNAVLLLGGMHFHMVLSGMLLKTPNRQGIHKNTQEMDSEMGHLTTKDLSLEANSNADSCVENLNKSESCLHEETNDLSLESNVYGRWINQIKKLQCESKFIEASGLVLFKNVSFVAISIATGTVSSTITGWVIYFIPHCLTKGLTAYEAAFLASLTGFMYLIGHFIPLITRNIISVRNYLYLSYTIAAISLMVDSHCTTFTTILVSNGCFVFSIGGVFLLLDVSLKAAVSEELLSKAFGWRMTVGGVTRIICSFIVGWLYYNSDSYNAGFSFLGAVQALGGFALAADHLRQNIYKKQQDKLQL